MGMPAKTPDMLLDHNCKDNPKWTQHCVHLTAHCGTSVVARMYCPHTCGSCSEKFDVSSFGLPKAEDPAQKKAAADRAAAEEAAKKKREAAAQADIKKAKDEAKAEQAKAEAAVKKQRADVAALEKKQADEKAAATAARKAKAAAKPAAKPAAPAAKPAAKPAAEEDTDLSYMKEESGEYDQLFGESRDDDGDDEDQL